VAFPEDSKRVEDTLEETLKATQNEHEKRMKERLDTIRTPSGWYDQSKTYEGFWKNGPDDWDDLKLRREQAKEKHDQALSSLPVALTLLGCRNCGYVEWRMTLEGK
jgi:hypothetical protein